jgi:hypothetical protein
MNFATIATLHGKLCSAQIRPSRRPARRSQVELPANLAVPHMYLI